MATVKEVLKALMDLPAEAMDMEMHICDSRSGIYNELNRFARIDTVTGKEGGGEICDLDPGTKYVRMSVG